MDTATVIVTTITTRTTTTPVPADTVDIAALTAILNAVLNTRIKANLKLDQAPAAHTYERGVLQGHSDGLTEAIAEIRNAISCYTA